MLEKLQQRWKVNGLNLVLIICTFALGGSLCGYAGRKILQLVSIDKGLLWFIVYIVLITLLWPICVLLVSIPLGQFGFFKRYLGKIWGRINGRRTRDGRQGTTVHEPWAMAHGRPTIAIFASGAGSNAKKIIESNPSFTIGLIVCNKPGAGVLQIAADNNIPALLIEKERFFKDDAYLEKLKAAEIDFIILAGFLWKIPKKLIEAFPNKIINIHPALLPNYGGKGMYGHHVHQAVVDAKEKESGITIHYVDELYDHGNIIFQAKCVVTENDTADTLAQKIHELEHEHYPRVAAQVIEQMQKQR
ncbi:formyltransferase family protein [Ferruginibacter sp. SUN002]|uniref:phosphoribosylglycinamide formyltransferase n=1 Tax=Ferruginibacter sp. SUN002 TaxID=2937789 RepID=UPI003D35BA12